MKPFIHEPTNFILDLDPAIAIIGNIVLFSPLFLILNHYNKSLNLEACLIICALSPAIIELLQRWIPGRVSSMSDLILNVAGLLGVYLIVKFRRRVQL
jgi:glycopeptide antibiotics resistance protein